MFSAVSLFALLTTREIIWYFKQVVQFVYCLNFASALWFFHIIISLECCYAALFQSNLDSSRTDAGSTDEFSSRMSQKHVTSQENLEVGFISSPEPKAHKVSL